MTGRRKDGRVELYKPFTGTEEVVVEMVAEGSTAEEVADALHVTVGTMRGYILHAAQKIPGSMPPIPKICLWWRRADYELLNACSTAHRVRASNLQ